MSHAAGQCRVDYLLQAPVRCQSRTERKGERERVRRKEGRKEGVDHSEAVAKNGYRRRMRIGIRSWRRKGGSAGHEYLLDALASEDTLGWKVDKRLSRVGRRMSKDAGPAGLCYWATLGGAPVPSSLTEEK